ncbi:hypothetical protein SO802_005868 [Lithocarpus litseifolius]|uniref:FBD domain-containing protein n=1 Tax=Lithocarpus litseifolius TaxID=425828 RepID=A0AAW2DN85_9ROSI
MVLMLWIVYPNYQNIFIHHILFLMPHKDAARTTVLSKSWKQVGNSLPRYDFTFCDGTYYDNSPAHFEKKIEKSVRNIMESLYLELTSMDKAERGDPGRLDSDSFACNNISFTPEELSKDLPIPPIATVEHLELGNVPIMQDYTALLDGLLWSCHPKVLLIRADSESKEFINFLSEILVIREEEPKCCGDSHMKCWRHYLKAVKSEPYLDGMESAHGT